MESFLEARPVEGLEQVVEGVDFEGAQGMLIVGGDEEGRRHAVHAHRFDHIEAIQFGHLDIQEHEVRPQGFDGHHRLAAIAAFARDVHIRRVGEKVPQALAGEGFVIHDEDTDGHGTSFLEDAWN